ncbi:MAG: CPBP family intramembrane metalloprotease [Oscillospiraceae bacterium]|nr:CPBP family intramembrane metalloprotease [Oscillospiraceae bacterium]
MKLTEGMTARRRFSRLGLGLLLMCVVQQGAAFAIAFAGQAWAPWLLRTDWFLLAANFAPLYLLGFPVLLLLFRTVPDLPAPWAAPSVQSPVPPGLPPDHAALQSMPNAVPGLNPDPGPRLFAVPVSPLYPYASCPPTPEPYPAPPPLPLKEAEKRAIPPAALVGLTLAGFLLMYIGNIVSTVLNFLIAQIKGEEVTNPILAMGEGSNPWVMLAVLVFLAPLTEEYVFRKLLYRKLGGYGFGIYALCSATVFAMYHMNLSQMIYAFLLGLLFAGVMYYSKQIRYTILLHMSLNLFGGWVPLVLIDRMGMQEAALVTGMITILLAAGGAVSIVLLSQKRQQIRREMPLLRMPKPTAVEILANPGIILLLIALVAMTVVSILM